MKNSEKDLNLDFENKNLSFNFFSIFLKNLINFNNHNSIYINEENIENKIQKVITRNNFTDNLDLAIYNKLQFFKNKDKILLMYINSTNFLSAKENLDINSVKIQLNEMINNLKNDFHDIQFVITSNPIIFNLFNLIPSNLENLSIRFLDYTRYVKFEDSLSGKFDIINLDKNQEITEKIKDMDKNLIFNYKTNFSNFRKILNYENLKDFLEFSKNKNKIFPYFESEDDMDFNFGVDNKVNNLNSKNFKDLILNEKNKKSLVLLTNIECNGCKKIQLMLNEISDEEKNNKFKFYKYDTMNENYLFKKYRNLPSCVIFENGKILKEIDLKKIINDNSDHDTALREVFSDILKNKYI